MRLLKYQRLFVGIVLVICAMVALAFYLRDSIREKWQQALFKPFIPMQVTEKPVKVPTWITVFVHGSFGSAIGLMNAYNVIQDQVLGTHYQKVIKKIRKDPYFYQDQIILERGLTPLVPSFDVNVASGKKFAAYPIVKAYDLLRETLKEGGQENNYYYTWGWSGLLSQKVRRYESVRLYNALCKEVEKFEKQGIHPKVRIVAHSHGGNVALNLGIVGEALRENMQTYEDINEHRAKALTEMKALFVQMGDEHAASNQQGNKRWDYMPTKKDLSIDELLIFGCPIQPETDYCVAFSGLKRVYNFYSDEDIIQKIDWISTYRRSSEQRFGAKYLSLKNDDGSSKLIQVRVMIGRTISKKGSDDSTKTEDSFFWQTLKKMQRFFLRKYNDPTHKEFWFVAWKEPLSKETLAPLPTVVFAPAFCSLIERYKESNDVDINILIRDTFTIALHRHEGYESIGSITLPLALITELKEKVLMWKPQDYSPEKSFQIINSYSKE